MYSQKWLSRKQILTLISLLIIVPTGFYSKFYKGPAAFWVNNSLGGVFYEIFWCLVLFFFSKSTLKPRLIAVIVLLITCCLECLQLWHPPFLQYLRSHLIGSAILGTTFVWSDFIYYFAGCGIGWFWMNQIENGLNDKKETQQI